MMAGLAGSQYPGCWQSSTEYAWVEDIYKGKVTLMSPVSAWPRWISVPVTPAMYEDPTK